MYPTTNGVIVSLITNTGSLLCLVARLDTSSPSIDEIRFPSASLLPTAMRPPVGIEQQTDSPCCFYRGEALHILHVDPLAPIILAHLPHSRQHLLFHLHHHSTGTAHDSVWNTVTGPSPKKWDSTQPQIQEGDTSAVTLVEVWRDTDRRPSCVSRSISHLTSPLSMAVEQASFFPQFMWAPTLTSSKPMCEWFWLAIYCKFDKEIRFIPALSSSMDSPVPSMKRVLAAFTIDTPWVSTLRNVEIAHHGMNQSVIRVPVSLPHHKEGREEGQSHSKSRQTEGVPVPPTQDSNPFISHVDIKRVRSFFAAVVGTGDSGNGPHMLHLCSGWHVLASHSCPQPLPSNSFLKPLYHAGCLSLKMAVEAEDGTRRESEVVCWRLQPRAELMRLVMAAVCLSSSSMGVVSIVCRLVIEAINCMCGVSHA
eukprot:GHVN01035943.1.p1 GENE.GHVN01035943.1~~GHVN01035943.1.p1  ORF type:complete len:422 (+),score=65.99 GHVN01035943.1:882-2147(+)